eukprot:m.47691 g.47691  ORF g.47691 m.47691 type:complete len:215 (+) comp17689_c0_seq2:186-830(+)
MALPVHQTLKFKAVLLGQTRVGKTSLLQRYLYNHFEETFQPTIGIDFLSNNLTVNNHTIRLQLWDAAGSDRFSSLIPSYIRDAAAAVIVYDISDRSSFEQVNKWVDQVRSQRQENVVLFLVGNKCDLQHKRQVTHYEGEKKARDIGARFFETSAKSGKDVHKLFQTVGEELPGPHQNVGSDVQPADFDIIVPREEDDSHSNACGICAILASVFT